MSDKDGGQAFPVPAGNFSGGETWQSDFGMSLRDWFAGQALIGVVADWGETAFKPDAIAGRAYALAEAMLRVRHEKTSNPTSGVTGTARSEEPVTT